MFCLYGSESTHLQLRAVEVGHGTKKSRSD